MRSVDDLFTGPGLDQRYPKGVRESLTVDVHGVPDEDAALIFIDPLTLAAHGVEVGPYGLMTSEQEAVFAKGALLRPPNSEETPTHRLVATRYFDFVDSVRGDGRAGVLSGPLQAQGEDPWTGKKSTTRSIIRLKGIDSGQRPAGQTAEDSHGHGMMNVVQSIHDAVHQLSEQLNGQKSPKPVGIGLTGREFQYRNTHNRDRFMKARQGYLLELGRFERAAHLLPLAKSLLGQVSLRPGKERQRVRAFLADINHQVTQELGRSRPLSMIGLFAHLCHRRGIELADQYWLRTQHGSPTFDNIGLLENIDHGTMAAQDRTHPEQGNSHVSRGFAGESEQFLHSIAESYFPIFYKAASASERKRLKAWSQRGVIDAAVLRPFQRRMAENALSHLGFAPSQVRALMLPQVSGGRRETALEFAAWLRDVAQTPEPEAEHKIVDVRVKTPARYDIHAALAAVPEALQLADEAKAIEVVRGALAALKPDEARDRAVAKALLERVRPLVEHVQGVAGFALSSMADLASTINASRTQLYATNLRRWIQKRLDRIDKKKMSPLRFRAEVFALARSALRRGPFAPSGVLDRLERGLIKPDERGRYSLASVKEHGVHLQEISDGQTHGFRFTLGGDLLELGSLKRYRARYHLGDGKWKTLRPIELSRGEPVFETTAKAPGSIAVEFFDAENPSAVWNLDGMPFGEGHRPVLQSLALRRALEARQEPVDRAPWARAQALHSALQSGEMAPEKVLEAARRLAGFRYAKGDTVRMTEEAFGDFRLRMKTPEEEVQLEFSPGRTELMLTKNKGKVTRKKLSTGALWLSLLPEP